MKTNTKKLCEASIILAILITSQIFKNLSVYITGPIVNLCLLTCTILVDKKYGLLLSIASPITAFFITGSPIMSAVPIIIPFIILGNIIYVLTSNYFFKKNCKKKFVIGLLLSSISKGLFMGLTIIPCIKIFLAESSPLRKMIPIFTTTFSSAQIITAIIASIIFLLIYKRLKKFLDANEIAQD